jgi:hypothetical protein
MIARSLLALSACVMALPLSAQSATEVCEALGGLEVGQWVEYQVSSPQGQMTMRQALVGTDTRAGTEYLRLETKMNAPQMGGEMIMQMLITSYPYEQADIQELVLKAPGQPAMIMSEQMMQMMRSQMPDDPSLDVANQCGDADVIGWESLTVAAGTFRALHLRPHEPGEEAVGDVWVSTEIPFGLIKAVMPGEDGSIELLGHGTDATSSITETPTRMPGGRDR